MIVHAPPAGLVPVGTVCAFAGQVSPSSEGPNDLWGSTACGGTSGGESGPQPDDGPIVLVEAQGWLLCDGRFLGTARYPALFGVLGYRYGKAQGADGASTFRIPDYRGLFLRGVDHGAGLDPDCGSRTGPTGQGTDPDVGSLQCDALQSHTHDYDKPVSVTIAEQGPSAGMSTQPTPTSEPNDPARTSSETRGRNVAVNFLIRAF